MTEYTTEADLNCVTIKGDGVSFPCTLSDKKWNGWEIPSFNSHTALKVMQATDASYTGNSNDMSFFIIAQNSLVAVPLKEWLTDPENTELEPTDVILMADPQYEISESEVYTAQIIDGKPHWSIGACSWCWEKSFTAGGTYSPPANYCSA